MKSLEKIFKDEYIKTRNPGENKGVFMTISKCVFKLLPKSDEASFKLIPSLLSFLKLSKDHLRLFFDDLVSIEDITLSGTIIRLYLTPLELAIIIKAINDKKDFNDFTQYIVGNEKLHDRIRRLCSDSKNLAHLQSYLFHVPFVFLNF